MPIESLNILEAEIALMLRMASMPMKTILVITFHFLSESANTDLQSHRPINFV